MKEEVKKEHEPVTNKFISDEPAMSMTFMLVILALRIQILIYSK